MFRRAFFYCPAGLVAFGFSFESGKQKKELALDMHGYIPPALLVAVNGFQRRTEQFGHLFLGFVQTLSIFFKFGLIHVLKTFRASFN